MDSEIIGEGSISDNMLRGRLCFSASKYEAEDIVMEVAEKVAASDLLNVLKVIEDFPDKSKFDTNVKLCISKIMGNIDSRSFVKIYNIG